MRNGNVIGTHGLSFAQKGRTDLPPPETKPATAAGTPPKPEKPAKPAPPAILGPLTVTVVIDIAVKLGPIPLYRYNNESTEHWDGDRLINFVSATNDNGVHTKFMAHRDDGKLWIETIKQKYLAPEDAIPSTYWNPHTLTAPLFDNIDGKLLHARFDRIGPESISAANGDHLDAIHFNASGDLHVDLWYMEDKPKPGEKPGPLHWVGLALTGSDGSRIIYEKM
jgi:hypothetical protein